MALLGRQSPRHAKWLAAPALSYDPYQGSFLGAPGSGDLRRKHVGALSPGGVLELGKQGIDLSDQIVRDLDIPVMQEAIDLLDKVYWTADRLGVGPEVRTAITAIRGAEYAGVAANAVVPASAAAAGTGVFLGIGAVAALGAIGAIGAALSVFFGGSDDAEAAAVKRAQAEVLHLRDRLSIAELAAEQDATAQQEVALSLVPTGPTSSGTHKAAALRAQKLAAFYRELEESLSQAELALFESLSNLARWTASLRAYDALPQPKRDGLDVMFGKSAPRLPYQLKGPIEAETKRLRALTDRVQAERRSGLASYGLLALVTGAVGLGLYAAVDPRGAAALVKHSASQAYGLGATAVRKVRGTL